MGDTNQLIAPLAEALIERQNADGGWGYTRNSSWTEPTSLALIALGTTGAFGNERAHGQAWLRRLQREDGGWPPHPDVEHSTWVTAAVLMVPSMRDTSGYTRGIEWLMGKTGRESTFIERARRFLRGTSSEVGEGTTGWPWFPDTAGWVTPTAFAILALQKALPENQTVRLRIAEGQTFLLARICADGGWNHGGAQALGQAATSYPDTTGQALLALRDVVDTRLKRAVVCAHGQLIGLRSAEASSWLEMGLCGHGLNVREPLLSAKCRTTNALALTMLTHAARRGNVVL
jgi:hypothetical protein